MRAVNTILVTLIVSLCLLLFTSSSLITATSTTTTSATGNTVTCRALALGGGGDRGAYEAGVLKALVELQPAEEVQYDVVTGISAGSLNAAGFCQFPKGQEHAAKEFLIQNWLSIQKSQVYKNWVPGGVVQGFAVKSGLFDTTPLRETLGKLLDLNKLKNSDRWLHIGTTNLNKARIDFFDQTSPNLIDGIMASSAVPGVFPPVNIGGDLYVDGGVEYMDAISDSVRLCYEKYNTTDVKVKLDVVLAISDFGYPGILDRLVTTPFILMHSMFTILNNIMIADIQNARIAFPKTEVRVFKPTKWPPGWFLGFNHASDLIQLGYSDASSVLKQQKL